MSRPTNLTDTERLTVLDLYNPTIPIRFDAVPQVFAEAAAIIKRLDAELTAAKQTQITTWIDTTTATPGLLLSEERCPTSPEILFQHQHGEIYHGWYIKKEVDNSMEIEGLTVENITHQYWFCSNVWDELFSEDEIKRWMYVPAIPEATL